MLFQRESPNPTARDAMKERPRPDPVPLQHRHPHARGRRPARRASRPRRAAVAPARRRRQMADLPALAAEQSSTSQPLTTGDKGASRRRPHNPAGRRSGTTRAQRHRDLRRAHRRGPAGVPADLLADPRRHTERVSLRPGARLSLGAPEPVKGTPSARPSGQTLDRTTAASPPDP